MLPANQNWDNKYTQTGGLEPDQMWSYLLKYFFTNVKLQTTDQAFIDEWEKAIDMYGTIFKDVTLTVSTGSGLPKTLSGTPTLPTTTGSAPTNFSLDCPSTPLDMDCAAEATILHYFEMPTVGGSNAKAVMEDGLKGNSPGTFDSGTKEGLGIMGVKLVSQSTYSLGTYRVLGGAQFATAFSQRPAEEGCASNFDPKGLGSKELASDVPADCLAPEYATKYVGDTMTKASAIPLSEQISPEQAAFNVLKAVFDGTSVTSFFGFSEPYPDTAPLNYLQIYGPDIEYANSQNAGTIPAGWTLDPTTGAVVSGTKVQDLLNLASEDLSAIAD
jgi:hypothetical protein